MDPYVVNTVCLQIWDLVGGVRVILLGFDLIHHVELRKLFPLRHIDIVEDDLLVVRARFVPFNDHTIVKGLEDSDALNRVWLVLEIFCLCLLNPLLVGSDLFSFHLLSDQVFCSFLDIFFSKLPLIFLFLDIFIIFVCVWVVVRFHRLLGLLRLHLHVC